MKISFRVNPDEDNIPAYAILKSRFGMSGLLVKRIRLYGSLLVNGNPTRMKSPLHVNDEVIAEYSDESEIPRIREDCKIPILYDDDWIIVCEKPGNLVTHPSWQHMDDSLIQRLSSSPLNPVMRLDRETSGLIVIAKNGYAHHRIISMPMEKKYLAIVHGHLQPEEGTIREPIGRADNSIMIRVVRDDGHPSVTHYKVLRYREDTDLSLVQFQLETGRCHQIRVHSLSLGHPLVGDGLYGPFSQDFPNPNIPSLEMDKRIGRQALHACYLSFWHPITGEKMTFMSPMPEDMAQLINT